MIRGVGRSLAPVLILLFSSQTALAQFTQQGPKLVGTGAVGTAEQGTSIALSSDGNTAIVGGAWGQSNHGRRERRGGVGLHSRRRRLGSARQQTGWNGSSWACRARCVRRAIGRRRHGDRRRAQ
jgi:hypothetical protein